MSRLFLLIPLLSAAMALMAPAQTSVYPLPSELIGQPKNGFTASVRIIGRASVTFRNIGALASPHAATDVLGEVARTYDDGNVGVDSRSTDNGENLPDDFHTNSWGYLDAGQVTADGSAIAFHSYSTTSNGSTAEADAPKSAGVDLEYSYMLGKFGKPNAEKLSPVTWGVMGGFGFNGINGKTRDTITADLHTLTDIYSLDGAPPPPAPYSAPSTGTVTDTNSDGSTSTRTVDTTTLLMNRPYSRSPDDVTPNGANVEGFWQVRGAYYTLRAGPWVRWQPTRRLSFRASAGLTYTFLGLKMRYDEHYARSDGVVILQDAQETKDQPYSVGGAFGSLDAEFWLTNNTGFFLGVVYEKVSRKAALTLGGRVADIDVSNGSGLRFGLTTRF